MGYRDRRDLAAAAAMGIVAATAGIVASLLPQVELLLLLVGAAAGTAIVLAPQGPVLLLGAVLTALFVVPPTIDLPADITTIAYYGTVVASAAAYLTTPRYRRSATALPWLLLAAPACAALLEWTGVSSLLIASRFLFAVAAGGRLAAIVARNSPESFDTLIRLLLWFSVAVAVNAVIQRVVGRWPVLDEFAKSDAYTSEAAVGRVSGTFGQPVIYGMFAQAMVVIAYLRRPALWQIVLVANLLGLVLCGARSAWVTLIVTSLFGVVAIKLGGARFPRVRRVEVVGTLLTVGCVFVGVAVAAPQAVEGIQGTVVERFQGEQSAFSTTARAAALEIGWHRVTASPDRFVFGYGPNASSLYWTDAGKLNLRASTATFDNSYLMVLHDWGLIGLIALASTLFAAIFSRRKSLLGRLLLVGVAVELWFFDAFAWPLVAGLVVLASGLLAQSQDDRQAPVERPQESSLRAA